MAKFNVTFSLSQNSLKRSFDDCLSDDVKGRILARMVPFSRGILVESEKQLGFSQYICTELS